MRRGGLFGAGVASPAAAAVAAVAAEAPVAARPNNRVLSKWEYNAGVKKDDDNPIEVYGDKAAVCEGKFYVVKDFGSIVEQSRLVQRLIQSHRTYTARDFITDDAPHGVYTFLVVIDRVSHEDCAYRLVAKQVVSMLEIGTRHNAIAHDESLAVQKILCGGELMRTPTGLRFNLQSGHYTLTRFKKTKLGALVDANVDTKSARYAAAVNALLPGAINVPVAGDSTFITEAAIGDTPIEELQLYTECGLSVFQFDSSHNALAFQEHATYEMSEEEKADVLLKYNGLPFGPDVTAAALGGAKALSFASPGRKSRKRRSSSRSRSSGSSRSSRSRSNRKTRRSSRNIRR
jgi:hypothetical protein